MKGFILKKNVFIEFFIHQKRRKLLIITYKTDKQKTNKQQQQTLASLTCRVCGLPFLTVCCPHSLQISPYPVQKWSPYTFKPRRKNFRVCRELKFQLQPAHPPEIFYFIYFIIFILYGPFPSLSMFSTFFKVYLSVLIMKNKTKQKTTEVKGLSRHG